MSGAPPDPAAGDHEVVVTDSGALAMRDRGCGEVMHPVVGPFAEVEALYLAPSRLAARLAEDRREPLVLYDVGLGAGSSAALAWRLSEARRGPGRPLEIVSFDRTLGALALALTAESAAAFGLDGAAGDAARALLARGEHAAARTRWRIVQGDVPASLAAGPGGAEVVFWDPFSPRANPELWTAGAFARLRARCGPGVTVHTYGAATATRAALLLAGFAVGAGAPSGTARQTTVAALDPADLVRAGARPLDRRWLDRLARSSAPLPPDAPPDALARIRAGPLFSAG